jgi:hypothetical protein
MERHYLRERLERTTRRSRPHKLPLVVTIVFSCGVSEATQNIAIKGRDWVVIGADSRITTPGASPSQACKIFQVGTFFWTSGGIDHDRSTGFRIESFFSKDAVSRFPRVEDVLNAIGTDLLAPLQQELPILQREFPWLYSRVMSGQTDLLDLTAARVSQERVEMYLKKFPVLNGRVITQPAATCEPPSRDKAGLDRCMDVTLNPGVNEYIDSHPDIWSDTVVSAVDRIMKAAEAGSPETVGPPFSILEITVNGARWLRQNDCPDIKRK